ncbi:hypothetical protein VNO77_07623 [Canavalia gladiata]|uniref:Uncharacterized protein n=1 Tax=Canavalia gladiata TaxID=3824 RepID=A0AAN9M8L5_CANGL
MVGNGSPSATLHQGLSSFSISPVRSGYARNALMLGYRFFAPSFKTKPLALSNTAGCRQDLNGIRAKCGMTSTLQRFTSNLLSNAAWAEGTE